MQLPSYENGKSFPSMPRNEHDFFNTGVIHDSFNAFTESIEEHFEFAARSLQDAFKDTPWLPEAIRPKASPPPPSPKSMNLPNGYFESSRHWISEHRAVTAAVVTFIGTGVFIVWRRRRADRAKRRAKRAKNGAKIEVIILAGSPLSPLTRSLSFDLERRGFVVYIPTSSLVEEESIQRESKKDIRALSFDLTSVGPFDPMHAAAELR